MNTSKASTDPTLSAADFIPVGSTTPGAWYSLVQTEATVTCADGTFVITGVTSGGVLTLRAPT